MAANIRLLFILLTVWLIYACSTTEPLNAAKLTEPFTNVTCEQPYLLTRGCGLQLARGTEWLIYADLNVVLKDQSFAFSSSENGKVLYITQIRFNLTCKRLIRDFTFGLINPGCGKINDYVNEVEKELNKNGVRIVDIHAHEWSGDIVGYFLILNGNGYDILYNYILE